MGQTTQKHGSGQGGSKRRSSRTPPAVSRASQAKVAFPYEEYDHMDVALGDILRGERATVGKSLLDVERDLKIKASYIAAIEHADLAAFASPGFIAGYVRSYARYLGLDPEWTFARFQRESGFYGVHGFSAKQADAAKRRLADAPGARIDPNDVIRAARVNFAPEKERWSDKIEPGALGSIAVLVALVLGIGYGAWAVLYDIQRLQFAPIDDAPESFAQLDDSTLDRLTAPGPGETGGSVALAGDSNFDRIYRPQALEAPVLTPRDRPLASLDPDATGVLVDPEIRLAERNANAPQPRPDSVQVTQGPVDDVLVFAVRPTWLQVRSASGTVLFEGNLAEGESFTLPATAQAPDLRTSNGGSIYFAVNGVTFGPAGEVGAVARDVTLTADAISERYFMADPTADPDLPRVAALVLNGETSEGSDN
ncbi:MAG: RodZ domain-containing protein [Pseudomonadota bacterium]